MAQNNDFFLEKQKAVERMKEFQARSRRAPDGMPPTPSFVSAGRRHTPHDVGNSPPSKPLIPGLDLSFLSGDDPDVSLLLGLFLLLKSENSDRLLLYALLYILL